MHDGCTGPAADGARVVNKVRMMGFAAQPLPLPLELPCHGCGETLVMATFESACGACGMVHAVTPCSADNPANVRAAGVGA
jgi:hypothetical protein